MILELLKNDHSQSLNSFRDKNDISNDSLNLDIKVPWFEQSINKVKLGT